MCTTCGCGEGNLYIEGDEHNPHSAFRSAPFAPAPRQMMTITGVKTDNFSPTRSETGDLHYGHGEAGTHAPGQSQRRMLEVEIDVLDKNNRLAARNRTRFAANHGILIIENVGNLVCPASFDLGERHKVAVLSVTEGEDKPLKYPHMFAAASLMLLNKVDLLPYLNFDVEKCLACAREVNPDIDIILLSATSGEGMDQWLSWLETQQCA